MWREMHEKFIMLVAENVKRFQRKAQPNKVYSPPKSWYKHQRMRNRPMPQQVAAVACHVARQLILTRNPSHRRPLLPLWPSVASPSGPARCLPTVEVTPPPHCCPPPVHYCPWPSSTASHRIPTTPIPNSTSTPPPDNIVFPKKEMSGV
jgi:hypothetical protein